MGFPRREHWGGLPFPPPGEPHEQYGRAKKKRYRKMSPPSQKVSNILLGKSEGQLLTATDRESTGPKRDNSQLWMSLGVKVKCDTVKNNIAQEPVMLGPRSKVNRAC